MRTTIATTDGKAVEVEVTFTSGTWTVVEQYTENGATYYNVSHTPTGMRLCLCRTQKTAEWACRQAAMYMRPELDVVPFGVDPRTVLDHMTLTALAREKKRICAGVEKRDEV